MSQDTPQVAIYARQSVDEDQGIRQQLADCRAEAARRDWQVVAEYVDNDTSGSKSRAATTAWAAMLKALDAGEADTVLANDVDRLTRQLTDVLEITKPKRDVRVVTVRGGIDTALDDYMLKQLVLLAEREVRLKETRRKRYAQERHAQGHPKPGSTPHGYRWVIAQERDASGTRFVVDPDEAKDIRYVFDAFLAGVPLYQIAKTLNEQNRPTRYGGSWHTGSLRRTLMNPYYAALLPPLSNGKGERKAHEIDLADCRAGAWEPIVTEEQLRAARATLLQRKPKHQGTARKWLLGGLAICSKCGAPARSARATNHPTPRRDGTPSPEQEWYHAYRCPKGHFHRAGDYIDAYVEALAVARLTQPDARALFEPPDEGPALAVLVGLRTELDQREEQLAAALADGLSWEAAKPALDKIKAERETTERRIAEAMRKSPLPPSALEDDIREWWAGAGLEQRRLVVDTLMTVEIQPLGMGRRVRALADVPETVTITWKG